MLFKRKPHAPIESERSEAGVVAWVITIPAKGSGGHRTIFHNAAALGRSGMTCEFYILHDANCCIDLEVLRNNIKEWFDFDTGPIRCVAYLPPYCDTAIATAWNTARYVSMQSIPKKYYFVQDYEPFFYPIGDEFIEAEASYDLGLMPITIGRWLSKKMEGHAGVPVPFVEFGVNDEVYQSCQKDEYREHALCAVFQPAKPRRLSRLLKETLEIVHELDPSLKIYVFGSDSQGVKSGWIENLGLLSIDECAHLYRRCEMGLCFSATNPSRVPFEMMACGLPVIDIAGENTSLDFPDDAVALAKPRPESVAATVVALSSDAALRTTMGKAGVAYGKTHSLAAEGEQFVDAMTQWHSIARITDEANSNVFHTPAEEIWTGHLRKANEAIAAWQPFHCNDIAIIVEPTADLMAFSSVRVACWSHPDQSDLQWIELEPVEKWSAGHRNRKMSRLIKATRTRGALLGLVTLPENRSKALTMTMHFYAKNSQGEERFYEACSFGIYRPDSKRGVRGFIEKPLESLGSTLVLRAR